MAQYFVRKADLKYDREEILALWCRNGLHVPDSAVRFFSWAHDTNPVGQGCYWLLVHAPTGHIVGTIGLFLHKMKICDSIELVGRAGGLAVDKEHRSLGPALMLGKAMLNDMAISDLSFIYTLAPPKAFPVFQRLGFKSIGEVDCLRKIISISNFVNNHFTVLPKFARNLLIYLLDIGIQFISKETWVYLKKLKIISIQDLDSRIDELWSCAAPHYSFTTERSSSFLRWRFNCKDYFYNALCTIDGKLCGYAIYQLDQNYNAYVVDLFAKDQGAMMINLLAGLARYWRSIGVKTVSIHAVGSKHFFNNFKKFGFSKWGLQPPSPSGQYELFISPIKTNHNQLYNIKLEGGFLTVDDFIRL